MTKSKNLRARAMSLVVAAAAAFGFGAVVSPPAAGSSSPAPPAATSAGSDDVVAMWTVPSPTVAGPGTVSVSVTDYTTSAIRQINLADDGYLFSHTYADGQTNPVVAESEVFLSTGAHELTAAVTLFDSRTYVLHQSVTARKQLRIDLGGSTYAIWGDWLSFTARVTANTIPQPGLRVTLQSRPAGSAIWTTRAAAVTNDNGEAAFPRKSSRIGNASWRVLSAASATQFAGTTNAIRVPIYAKVGRSARSTTIHRGQTKIYVLHVHPWEPGARVRLWRIDPMRASGVRTLAIGTVRRGGLVRLAVTLHHAGRYSLGATRLGAQRVHRTNFIGGWKLTVTK